MNGAQIAARVAQGYAKAGAKLGTPHTLYRPIGPLTAALDGGNRVRSLSFLSSATPDLAFARPSKYGNQVRYGLCDPTHTRVGDYIDGPTGTFFVASQDPDECPMVVQCNAVVSVTEPTGDPGPGIGPYGGRVTASDITLVSKWPASLLLSGRTIAGKADLPGDVPLKGAQMLLPTGFVTLRTSLRLMDDQGRHFAISGAELTDLGWRCELVVMVT